MDERELLLLRKRKLELELELEDSSSGEPQSSPVDMSGGFDSLQDGLVRQSNQIAAAAGEIPSMGMPRLSQQYPWLETGAEMLGMGVGGALGATSGAGAGAGIGGMVGGPPGMLAGGIKGGIAGAAAGAGMGNVVAHSGLAMVDNTYDYLMGRTRPNDNVLPTTEAAVEQFGEGVIGGALGEGGTMALRAGVKAAGPAIKSFNPLEMMGNAAERFSGGQAQRAANAEARALGATSNQMKGAKYDPTTGFETRPITDDMNKLREMGIFDRNAILEPNREELALRLGKRVYEVGPQLGDLTQKINPLVTQQQMQGAALSALSSDPEVAAVMARFQTAETKAEAKLVYDKFRRDIGIDPATGAQTNTGPVTFEDFMRLKHEYQAGAMYTETRAAFRDIDEVFKRKLAEVLRRATDNVAAMAEPTLVQNGQLPTTGMFKELNSQYGALMEGYKLIDPTRAVEVSAGSRATGQAFAPVGTTANIVTGGPSRRNLMNAGTRRQAGDTATAVTDFASLVTPITAKTVAAQQAASRVYMSVQPGGYLLDPLEQHDNMLNAYRSNLGDPEQEAMAMQAALDNRVAPVKAQPTSAVDISSLQSPSLGQLGTALQVPEGTDLQFLGAQEPPDFAQKWNQASDYMSMLNQNRAGVDEQQPFSSLLQ